MPYVTFGHCDLSTQNDSDSKHMGLLLNYDDRLYRPRPLDRYYYDALSDDKMQDRDRSQVVTRELLKKEFIREGIVAEGTTKWPYLVVNQLWVWVIDDGKRSSRTFVFIHPRTLLICPVFQVPSSLHRRIERMISMMIMISSFVGFWITYLTAYMRHLA